MEIADILLISLLILAVRKHRTKIGIQLVRNTFFLYNFSSSFLLYLLSCMFLLSHFSIHFKNRIAYN